MSLFDECREIVDKCKPLKRLNEDRYRLDVKGEKSVGLAGVRKNLTSGNYDASGGATRLAMSMLPLEGTLEGEKLVESKWLIDAVGRMKSTGGRR